MPMRIRNGCKRFRNKKNDMRIAFFVQYNHTVGTYFRWHNMAKALQLLGHEVDIYAGDHNWKALRRIESRDGITYTIIPSWPTARILYAPNDIFSAIRWLFNLPQKEYDVYHLYQPFLHASLAWNYLRYTKKRAIFVYDWDDLWTNGLFQQSKGVREKYVMEITKWLEAYLPQKAHGITVCSTYLKEKLRCPEKAIIINNGYWPQPLPNKKALRLKWGLQQDITYLAYIGKTADELDWVMAAFSLLKENEVAAIELIIAGPPAAYVQQLINDCKYGALVRYLGSLTAADAAELAAAVNLGMIPLSDNAFNKSRFPVKFLDFLSVQTPVYVSQVGEIGQLAKRLPGAFVGPGEKDSWIKGILSVVQELLHGVPYIPNDTTLSPFQWLELAKHQYQFYITLAN